MRKMGGLRRFMPVTYWTFLVATLALAGFPLTAGFFSKDEILLNAFTNHSLAVKHLGPILWGAASVAALGTAFYMTRAVAMTFWGEYRGGHAEEHGHAGEPHESPWTMRFPLIVLAVLSFVAGWVGTPWRPWFSDFLHSAFDYMPVHQPPEESLMYGLMGAATAVALLGILLGYCLIHRKPDVVKAFVEKNPGLYKATLNKFYVDELYQATVIRPLLAMNGGCARFDNDVVDGSVNLTAAATEAGANRVGFFDNEVIDGAVNGVADCTMAAGARVRRAQTGNVRSYVATAMAGVVVLVTIVALTLILGG